MTHVDPAAVMTAAQKINLTGLAISQKARDLGSSLSDMLGMAGTDTAAQSFAGAYDPAARDLFAAIGKLGEGATKIGLVLGASAHNHNDANAAAAHRPAPDIGSMPGQELTGTVTASLPNSAGDPSPGPWWWKIIAAYVQGKVWPNGHQDKLRKAADAWDDFAQDATNQAEGFYQGLQTLQNQDSEDIDAGLLLSTDAYQNLFAVAQNAKTLAQVCRDHAQHIDDAHSQIEEAAAEIIIETGLIWAAGALLTAFTGGGSDAAAGALSATNLTRIGANIARIITGFEGAAAATAAGAIRVAPAAAGITTAMTKAAALPVTRIAATAAGANAARLSAQEQAELSRLANQRDYEKYIAGKKAEGKPYRSFEDYLKARDTFAANGQKGADWEHAVSERHGLTPENGWEPPKYAPNGVKPAEPGARRWDFADMEGQRAVECKSGQVDNATFTRQFQIDKGMVNKDSWQITYYLKEPLNPSQMQQLTEFQAESGGRFSFQIGVP